MIDLKKLAAIDLVVHGPTIIRAEFGCGVFVCFGLSLFVLVHATAAWQFVLGSYLLALGLNYIPMLVWVVTLGDRRAALAELGENFEDRSKMMVKYRRKSVILLIPIVPLALILATRLRRMRPLERGERFPEQ